VELAFKRLAQRLGKIAVVMLSFFMIGFSAHGAEPRPAAEVIREVKADEAFKVHTVTDKIPKPRKSSIKWSGDWVEILMQVFAICAAALLVGLLGWMLWKYRHVFILRGPGVKEDRIAPSARVVMGMEVSPHSLPADVPGAAWLLWQQGRHHESLGLLYRGSISRVMELGRVEIHESDTEGDCVRRVDQAGAAVHPAYFRGITGAWIRLAYAGVGPADAEVKALCRQWPFGEGRAL
jgi:hypothetical protein